MNASFSLVKSRLMAYLACAFILCPTFSAFGQSQAPTPAAPQSQPNQVSPASPSAKAPPKKKAKKSKKAPAHDNLEPAGPAVETTKIEPSFTYRAAALKPNEKSVYHKQEHGDFADQLYLTLRFARTYNYAHEVVLEPSLRTFRNRPAEWEPYVIEQAYMESALSSHLTFTAGKKAEAEGPGFIVNPSDLLNENKDVFDPLYQKEGVVFSRLRFHTDAWSLGLGFIPLRGQPSSSGKGWVTAASELFATELRLQATFHATEKSTVGFSAQRFFGGSFELHADGRYQRRQRDPEAQGQGYLRYSSYSGENLEKLSDDSPSGYYLGGMRLIFTPRRTFVAEGIQQQSGLLPEDFDRFITDLRQEKTTSGKVYEPPTRLLGRHYVFASYQDDDSVSSTHLAASYLSNVDDKSAFATLSARYHLSPITSIELAPTFFTGRSSTEFGEMPFSQAHYLIFRGRF